ncbi:hypothetical protein [Nocardia shimofusensis]|uniref:hypothetical protein n=1 Tax=Nocardia shimofusensis TaxID=228596 RepID=UPI000AAC8536|nr:hypothetical protein [Nocardia shimofusensis]
MVGTVALTAAVGCADGGEQEGADLSAPPTEVRWQPYQGVALPHTAQGPEVLSDGAATGFEQSPPGAAVAAITHTVRLSVAPDGDWPAVVAKEVLPGPARDAWAVDRVRVSITGPADPEYAPRLRGYRITEYTGERGLVDVYTEYSDGSLAVNHTAVEWSTQDWRLRLPDLDSTARPIAAVDALPGDIVTLEAPK